MAISLEDLIDLNLLTYYDEQIKKYIAGKLANASGSTRFMSTDDLPVEGKEDVLYVTDEGIKVWDPVKKKYVDIPGSTASSGDEQTWDTY